MCDERVGFLTTYMTYMLRRSIPYVLRVTCLRLHLVMNIFAVDNWLAYHVNTIYYCVVGREVIGKH